MVTFGSLDWCIVVASLALTGLAGYFVKKYIGTLSDYLVADRGMGIYVGTASLVSTEIGIVTYVYYSELGYVAGFSAFIVGIIAGVVTYAIGRSGFVIKQLRELEIMTIPEYLELRYARGVRILAGILMAVGGALNLGIFPKLEASFLNIVMGIPERYLATTMAILLLVVLVYTAVGGMVSLIVTNYIQYVLLSLGTVITTVVAIYAVGWSKIVQSVQSNLGGSGFNPFTNSELGTAFIVWQVVFWMAIMTTWQSIAMRSFSSKDSNTGKKIFSLTSILFAGRGILPAFWGIAALAFFGGEANRTDAMPNFLASMLPSGLLGLMVAGMLAASLSTYSGYLLAWSSIISQDIVRPYIRRPLTDRAKIRLTQATVIGLTIFIMVWGLIYKVPGPTYFYLTITANLFIAGTFITIVGGLYWKKSSTLGAYLAFILGAVGALGFFFLDLSATSAGVYSFCLSFLGLWVGSMLKPGHLRRKA